MGRHAFGSFSASRRSWWAILRQCTGLCLLVDTRYQAYLKKVSLDTLNVSLKIFFVLKLQWILLVFAFWPHQKTGFEASERNKDASHAPTARKSQIDPRCPPYHPCGCFPGGRFPKPVFENKTGRERRREEGEKRKKEGREKRKGEEAQANSPPESPECSACI
jgi:hypothetical protein